MNIYKIMMINALALIVLGIYGYSLSGSLTALIAPLIGLILFLLSFPVKNDNKTAAHIAVILTLISVITFFFIGIKIENVIVLSMAVLTLIALVFYIMDFVRRKKEREKNSGTV